MISEDLVALAAAGIMLAAVFLFFGMCAAKRIARAARQAATLRRLE